MRPIKFRAWDGIHMAYATLDELLNGVGGLTDAAGSTFLSVARKYGQVYNIEPFPVMQFTGLQDKNGLDIYEDDILGWLGEGNLISGNIFAVEWAGKRAAWYLGGMLNPIDMQDCVVIGNIYENPELLKRIDGNGIEDELTASEQRETEGNDTTNPGLRSEQ